MIPVATIWVADFCRRCFPSGMHAYVATMSVWVYRGIYSRVCCGIRTVPRSTSWRDCGGVGGVEDFSLNKMRYAGEVAMNARYFQDQPLSR